MSSTQKPSRAESHRLRAYMHPPLLKPFGGQCTGTVEDGQLAHDGDTCPVHEGGKQNGGHQ